MAKKRAKGANFRLAFSKVGKVLTGVSLAVLVVSSLMEAALTITTIPLENKDGIPTGWAELASGSMPARLTMPITYWDQREDPYNGGRGGDHEGRQFEWQRWVSAHGLNHGSGLQQGIVQDRLGANGFPVPSYTSIAEARAAGIALSSRGVVGHNPVRPEDPFYRWFNEVPGLSKRFDRTIDFHLVGDFTYQAGGNGRDFFPLDSIPEAMEFSRGDFTNNRPHRNFHFTTAFQTPFVVEANGTEEFQFSGDDDVWVFLNGRLVIDLGGLHQILHGSFRIGEADASGHIPVYSTVGGVTTVFHDVGLKAGEPTMLHFFHAERSTDESNLLITFRYMNVATAQVDVNPDEIVESPCEPLLINQSVSNTDPFSSLQVVGMTSWLNPGTEYDPSGGFINFNDGVSLQYSFNPNSDNWKTITLNPPSTNKDNSLFKEGPIILSPMGQSGDTVYFRYSFQANNCADGLFNVLSVKTESTGGNQRVENNVTPIIPIARVDLPQIGEENYEIFEFDIEPEPELDIEPGQGSTDLPPTIEEDDLEQDHSILFRVPNTGIGRIIFSKWWLVGCLATFAIIFALWRLNENYIIRHNLRGDAKTKPKAKPRAKTSGTKNFKVISPKSKTKTTASKNKKK
ncbi:fibro-slime domain-containing protein [Candidatus Saccharibacteria bacterium]|nr:fibro-slime domain-containing protein [Candidatus Saccharibacteria bacterium]